MAGGESIIDRMKEARKNGEPFLGAAVPINQTDSSMLDGSNWPTNRLVFDGKQSQLLVAWKALHMALREHDYYLKRKEILEHAIKVNLRAPTIMELEKLLDTSFVDAWAWMEDFSYCVETNQLTVKGYSRDQHLAMYKAQSMSVSGGEEQAKKKGIFG